jgi:branched-chain amino acid transport system permease protein
VALPLFVQELVTFLLPFGIFAILVLALNLHWGHTGLFNAGLAGFYAFGAYTAAILLTDPAPRTQIYPGHLGGFELAARVGWFFGLFGVETPAFAAAFLAFLLAAGAAFAVAAAVGFLIGIPTLKLRADYLAITTLALAEIFRLALRNARGLTAGTIGIVGIPRPFEGLGLGGPEANALLALLLAAAIIIIFVTLHWLTTSPWGRVLRAIRDDEEAAAVLGKDTFWFKLQAFTVGCGIMGLAGAFVATFNRVIVPDAFVPVLTFSIYVMILLGGSGNNKGALAGAAIFYMFEWASVRLKDGLPPGIADKVAFYRLMAIGILLILLVILRPQGIFPEKKYVPKKV